VSALHNVERTTRQIKTPTPHDNEHVANLILIGIELQFRLLQLKPQLTRDGHARAKQGPQDWSL
jgi:hypothetical protein